MRYLPSLCGLLAGCLWEERVTNPDPMPDGVCQWFIDHGAVAERDSADTGGTLIHCDPCGGDDWCRNCSIDGYLWTTSEALERAEQVCTTRSSHYWGTGTDPCEPSATVVSCVATGTL